MGRMEETRVGLIGGTGVEGRGIALRLAAAGTEVWVGSRSRERAADKAAQLNAQIGNEFIHGASNSEVVAQCGVLLLTVPYEHAAGLLERHAPQLTSDHVLVDVTVPLVFDKGPRLLALAENSAAEALRKKLPSHVPLTAAFKTLPAHLLCELEADLDCDEFLCGDSEEARQRVLQVVQKIPGIRWIDAGPLRFCRCLEGMTMLVIGLNRRYKARHGRFKVVGI